MVTPAVSSCTGTGGRSLRTVTVTGLDPVGGQHGGGDDLGHALEEHEPGVGDDGHHHLGQLSP
jgi:hypothetical protein